MFYQKQFFSGADHPLSTPDRLMRYDLEISGFPSSHAGHLVLLGLKDQDYPGSKRLDGINRSALSRRSAEWCLNAVNQCWTQKAARFRATELEAARQAYDHARQIYRQRAAEAAK